VNNETHTQNNTALIFAGGNAPLPHLSQFLPQAQWRIAADSGLDHALALGVTPDVVVGDSDSVSNEALALAHSLDIEFISAPTDKDFTDTELALSHAVHLGAQKIVVVSAGGGRFDHAHGLLTSLFHPEWVHIHIEAFIDTAHVFVLHGPSSLHIEGKQNSLVALHAMNGMAHGISTDGLRWQLHNESLAPWVSRGVSNELTGTSGDISLQSGALLVVQPEAFTQSTKEG
jgi:thiamine pyrophosphokinase